MVCALILAGTVGLTEFARGVDWETLRGNVQRWGFYEAFPKGPLKLKWRKELWPELTGSRAEVIISGGTCFVGTYAGSFYAWDLVTGAERWRFTAAGPIGHAAAASEGAIYFGSMDRRLYALDQRTGVVRWHFEAAEGIWVAPAVASGAVLFGDRAGRFYCLEQKTGRLIWSHETAGQILTTASVSEDGNWVVFGSEDMHLYCISIRSGNLRWRSRKLSGLSLRDYAPVLFQGVVMITSNPVKDFHTILGEHQQMLLKRTGYQGSDDRYIPGGEAEVLREQEAIGAFLEEHPNEQSFFAFQLEDGTEPWKPPVLYTGGLHNPPTPPCVDPRSGTVFTLVRSAYGVWDGGGEVRPYTAVGRLDFGTRRLHLVNHGHPSKEPGRPPGSKDMPWATFNTIGDETQTLACSRETLFCVHQGFIGSMNRKTGLTANLYGKRDTYGGFYGPGTFGWENQGGYDKADAAGQPFGIVNEWHGPARGLVSVSGKNVVFHVGAQVICLEGEP